MLGKSIAAALYAREKLGVGQGQYTFLLNDRAGVIDDLVVTAARR